MATDPTAEMRAEVDRLVDAARRGDRAAFDELVRRTYVDTYTLAMRLTANEEDARDVVQESYLRAWKGIRRFRGDAQFSTWMYRITANAAATLVQKRRRRRVESLETVDEPIEVSLEAQPEAATVSAVGMETLARAVEALPPKLRAIVVLKDVYGLPHEAIAEELGISVAAAKVRLHRGRKRLRDALYEEEGRSAHAV
jgi:RNA polymerase sigma-70 factor, ECF subfamily